MSFACKGIPVIHQIFAMNLISIPLESTPVVHSNLMSKFPYRKASMSII